jgi:hypothetical protein
MSGPGKRLLVPVPGAAEQSRLARTADYDQNRLNNIELERLRKQRDSIIGNLQVDETQIIGEINLLHQERIELKNLKPQVASLPGLQKELSDLKVLLEAIKDAAHEDQAVNIVSAIDAKNTQIQDQMRAMSKLPELQAASDKLKAVVGALGAAVTKDSDIAEIVQKMIADNLQSRNNAHENTLKLAAKDTEIVRITELLNEHTKTAREHAEALRLKDQEISLLNVDKSTETPEIAKMKADLRESKLRTSVVESALANEQRLWGELDGANKELKIQLGVAEAAKADTAAQIDARDAYIAALAKSIVNMQFVLDVTLTGEYKKMNEVQMALDRPVWNGGDQFVETNRTVVRQMDEFEKDVIKWVRRGMTSIAEVSELEYYVKALVQVIDSMKKMSLEFEGPSTTDKMVTTKLDEMTFVNLQDRKKAILAEVALFETAMQTIKEELKHQKQTIDDLADLANDAQYAFFDSTDQLKCLVKDVDVPELKKRIRRPDVPESGHPLETQSTNLLTKIGEYETAFGAVQTRLASNKIEIKRQKNEIDKVTADSQRMTGEIERLSKPKSTPVLVTAPASASPAVVSPNTEVKDLQDRIAYLENEIVNFKNDARTMRDKLQEQADRLASIDSAPVSPRSTHTPDSAQLFELLERLHKLVGPDFPHVLTEEKKNDFIDQCCIFFVRAIPLNQKREFILAIDKYADIRAHLDFELYTAVYQYLMGTPPPRARRGEWYGIGEDAVVEEELPIKPPFDTTLPSNDRSKYRKSPFEDITPNVEGKKARMPIVQLLTDLKTMHACM